MHSIFGFKSARMARRPMRLPFSRISSTWTALADFPWAGCGFWVSFADLPWAGRGVTNALWTRYMSMLFDKVEP